MAAYIKYVVPTNNSKRCNQSIATGGDAEHTLAKEASQPAPFKVITLNM